MNFKPVPYLLVVDPEESLTELEALLQSTDVLIHKARSGTEALAVLAHEDIALALIDVQLPDMNGFELAQRMHGNPQKQGVPVIFLTAGDLDKQWQYTGLEAGAVDFLHKPLDPNILKNKAGVFFDLYRKCQEISAQRDELELTHREAQQYAAALKEADQRKDEFLAMLAHELRTPLGPIRHGLEIMRREKVDAMGKRTCDMMDRQLTHVVQLIDDLMDMARVSKGKIELRKATIKLQDVIESAVDNAQPYMDDAGHELRVELGAAPIWIEADLTRVDQIISNLLSNAARYTPAGGTIVLSAQSQQGNAVITVADNGAGIPEHMQSRIFDLFTQVNASTGHAQGGLGVGLALVKHLLGLHGGSINVQSPGPDKGSTFTVRLPLTTPPSISTAPLREDDTMTTQALQILIVDDNEDSATTTGWLLESMGYPNYTLAHDGPDALEAAKKLLPDAILLDIGLPGMNGYEICRELRRNPLFADTLIVAQTGWGQDRDREMAYFAGFTHHLVKPLKPSDLETLFSKVIPRSAAMRPSQEHATKPTRVT